MPHDWTNTAAVIAPSVVALGAIGAGWRQNGAMLRTQRETRDLAEVRGVLDEAVVLLHRIAYDMDDAKGKMTPESMRSEDGDRLYRSLEAHGRDTDALLERLRVRLGRDHAVVRDFWRVDTAVLGFWRALGRLRNEPPSDGSRVARHSIVKLVDKTRRELNDEREAFDACRVSFIDEAQDVAGSKL